MRETRERDSRPGNPRTPIRRRRLLRAMTGVNTNPQVEDEPRMQIQTPPLEIVGGDFNSSLVLAGKKPCLPEMKKKKAKMKDHLRSRSEAKNPKAIAVKWIRMPLSVKKDRKEKKKAVDYKRRSKISLSQKGLVVAPHPSSRGRLCWGRRSRWRWRQRRRPGLPDSSIQIHEFRPALLAAPYSFSRIWDQRPRCDKENGKDIPKEKAKDEIAGFAL